MNVSFGESLRRLLQATEKNAEKWNVMLVDDEKIILSGALPVLPEALPEAEIHGFTDPAEATAFAGANKVQLTFWTSRWGASAALTSVEDTGPGFAPSDGDEPHIALDNIRRRLKAMCGGTLEIAPREQGGTRVTVFVPQNPPAERKH